MFRMPRLFNFEELEMYESQQYYSDIFSAVADDIRDYRDEKYDPSYSRIRRDEDVFRISDDDYNSFAKLMDKRRGIIRHAVEIILKALMKKNGVKVNEPVRYPDRLGRSNPYLSFSYVNKSNTRTGVKVIGDFDQISGTKYIQHDIEELHIKEEVDDIEIVVLRRIEEQESTSKAGIYYYEPDEIEETRFDSFNRNIQQLLPGVIRFVSLEDFFKQHFGDDEYSVFIKSVDDFNRQSESMIGYKSVFMPNELEVKKFKNGRLRSDFIFDFKRVLKTEMTQLHRDDKEFKDEAYYRLRQNIDLLYECCHKRFIDDQRYFALFGDKNFANSYISSEWYYYSSFETDILDKTSVAVGYLKSCEQLLYELLRLHIDDRRYKIQHGAIKKGMFPELIQKKENDEVKYYQYIPFKSKYEEIFNTTFGSLNKFVDYYKNDGILDESLIEDKELMHDWKHFIIKFLSYYSKNDLNEHLHKVNIYDADEISNIRNRTLLMYFLLLSSFKMDESEVRQIGGEEAFAKFDDIDDVKNGFIEWMDAKIEKTGNAYSKIVLRPCIDGDRNIELLCFAETDEFDLKDYNDEGDRLSYDEDCFEWAPGDCISAKDKGIILASIIKCYLDYAKKRGVIVKHKIILLLYGYGYHVIEQG